MVLLAPTGSGKTLAYLLPLLDMPEMKNPGVQVLIVAPSRELSIQIEQVFKTMGSGYKVNCCYGGHMIKTEKNNLKHPPAVLIGTPGRIADHIFHQRIDTTTIKVLILDEFDKSLEFGFQKEMSFIIRHLKHLHKRILTSATQALEIPDFTGITHPVELNFLSDAQSETLTIKSVLSDKKDKLETLFRLLCHIGNKPALVFCNHRESVQRVSDALRDRSIPHEIFHGGLEQDVRERTLLKFRNGSLHLLITTDLAARGLDIPEIEYIIHYHLPLTEDGFIHRNGRTARMNAKGTTYLILSKEEKLPDYIKEQPETQELPEESVFPDQTKWATLYIGAGKKDRINKTDIVGLILQKGKIQKDELGLIDVLDHASYAAVKSDKISDVLRHIRNETIKKKKVKFEITK